MNRGWAEDAKDSNRSGGLGRRDGETKMGSTLMVKIGLNRESRDDLTGNAPTERLRYRVSALPVKLG